MIVDGALPFVFFSASFFSGACFFLICQVVIHVSRRNVLSVRMFHQFITAFPTIPFKNPYRPFFSSGKCATIGTENKTRNLFFRL